MGTYSDFQAWQKAPDAAVPVTVQEFLVACAVYDPRSTARTVAVYEAYREFCAGLHRPILRRHAWGRAMNEAGIRAGKFGGQMQVESIRLKPREEWPAAPDPLADER